MKTRGNFKISVAVVGVMYFFMLFLSGCRESISTIPKEIQGKEVVVMSRIQADWANPLPENSRDLVEQSDLIGRGKVMEKIINERGDQTGVLYKVTKVYKGEIAENQVLVWYDGCYIKGEDYVLNHEDAQAGFEKEGSSPKEVLEAREKALEELSGKIVGVGLVEGQQIPELGETYLFFAWSIPESSEYGGTGHEYAQGLFLIHKEKIQNFEPKAKGIKELKSQIDVELFVNKAMGK